MMSKKYFFLLLLLPSRLFASCIKSGDDDDDTSRTEEVPEVEAKEFDVTVMVILPRAIADYYDIEVTYGVEGGKTKTEKVSKATVTEQFTEKEEHQWRMAVNELKQKVSATGVQVSDAFYGMNIVRHVSMKAVAGNAFTYTSKLSQRKQYNLPETDTVNLLYPTIIISYNAVNSQMIKFDRSQNIRVDLGVDVKRFDEYLLQNRDFVPGEGKIQL